MWYLSSLHPPNSNLSWKYWDSTTGTTALTLPTDYSELYIEIRTGLTEEIRCECSCFNVPRISIPTTGRRLEGGGYALSTSNSRRLIDIYPDKVQLVFNYNAGTNASAQTTVLVYYK